MTTDIPTRITRVARFIVAKCWHGRQAWRQFTMAGVLFLAASGTVVPAAGQAVLTLSSGEGPAAKTGHTELVGPVTLTVTSGTTVAGNVEILLPVPFNTPAGLMLSTTGGLAGTIINAVAPGNGLVKLTLPPGATAGATVTVTGIRVSVPNNALSSLSATVTLTGNSLTAGTITVPLIKNTRDPLVVDSSTDAQFTFNAATILVDPLGAFAFQEGFENAFSSAVGTLGRDAVTEVIFRLTGLPENTAVTFPDVMTAESGATLTTASGLVEVVEAGDENNMVRYLFADSVSSPTMVDAFSFEPILSTTGVPGPGTGVIQATVGPIGKEVPDAEFPETAVSRYMALYLPALGLESVTETFYFPVSPASDDAELVLTNTVVGGADFTVTAYDALGGSITGFEQNPRELGLQSRESVVLDLEDLFGTGASADEIALLEVVADNDRTVSSMLARSGANSFTVHSRDALPTEYFPFTRSTPASVPMLSVTNAGPASNFSFELRSDAGTVLGTTSTGILSGSSLREPLDAIFGIDPALLPLSGYVIVRSLDGSTMWGLLLSEPGGKATGVPGLQVTGRSRFLFPFFVTGGGYTTRVGLINAATSASAQITMRAIGIDGATVADTVPYTFSIPPRGRGELDLATAFPGIGAQVGYLEVLVGKLGSNPFSGVPLVTGTVRISTAPSDALIPIFTDDGSSFAFAPVASTGTEYTGVVLVNAEASNVSVTLEVFTQGGISLGSTTFSIASQAMSIRLLRELIPSAFGVENGFVELTSTGDVMALAVRGALDLSRLLYLRPEPN